MKKGFSIIMAFVTVMTMLFSGATFADDTNENTENKTKESNFTNLIVFARFLDEDEFIDNSYNGESVRKITDNTYNSAYFNVSDYYEIASRGSLKINSVYLFNKGGQCSYLIQEDTMQSIVKRILKVTGTTEREQSVCTN